MQIIGHTKDGYILSAKPDEIANLFGELSHWNMKDVDRYNQLLPIGREIPVKESYEALVIARNYRETLSHAKDRVTGVADDLGRLGELLDQAKENAIKIGEPELERPKRKAKAKEIV